MARRVEEMGIQEYQDHTLAINDQPGRRLTDDELLEDWKRRAGASTAKLYVGSQQTRRAQIKSIRAQYNNGRLRDHGKRDSSGRRIGAPDVLSLPYDEKRQPYAYDAEWLERSLDGRSPAAVGLPAGLRIGSTRARVPATEGLVRSTQRREPSVEEYAAAQVGGPPRESSSGDWLSDAARSISAAFAGAGLRYDLRFPPSQARPEHIAGLEALIDNEPGLILNLVDDSSSRTDRMAAPVAAAASYFDAAPPVLAPAQQRAARAVEWLVSAMNPERTAQVGRTGEQWVLELERKRLTEAGRSDLASAIDWTAKTCGAWPGYDIASFEVDGTPRLIEVKTTPGTATRPFFVSTNEVRKSVKLGDRFWLYRVYACFKQPRLYTLQGSLEQSCALVPSSYTATPHEREALDSQPR